MISAHLFWPQQIGIQHACHNLHQCHLSPPTTPARPHKTYAQHPPIPNVMPDALEWMTCMSVLAHPLLSHPPLPSRSACSCCAVSQALPSVVTKLPSYPPHPSSQSWLACPCSAISWALPSCHLANLDMLSSTPLLTPVPLVSSCSVSLTLAHSLSCYHTVMSVHAHYTPIIPQVSHG